MRSTRNGQGGGAAGGLTAAELQAGRLVLTIGSATPVADGVSRKVSMADAALNFNGGGYVWDQANSSVMIVRAGVYLSRLRTRCLLYTGLTTPRVEYSDGPGTARRLLVPRTPTDTVTDELLVELEQVAATEIRTLFITYANAVAATFALSWQMQLLYPL